MNTCEVDLTDNHWIFYIYNVTHNNPAVTNMEIQFLSTDDIEQLHIQNQTSDNYTELMTW